ncbi:hypothetical protein [Ferribacterium limneticum]|uniref:hypothetical protein n=1 Tax=Ferribacterium limneticum TaxID=76259 RepID=UPI001CF8C96B|nr:hypothetical protein [Ferribacterium limneticum]UCV23498.1 hypothetical protein KI613_02850 [Ferribacterium limneticum]
MVFVLYFFVGSALIFAAIAGSYSLAIGGLGLGAAYYLFRGSRWIKNEGTLFPEIALPAYDHSDFEVISESEDELVIRGSIQALIINRQTKKVTNLKRVLCSFDRIKYIRIHYSGANSDGAKPGYSVFLSLGVFSSISLGESSDPSSASRVAAKLSTWTGKQVVS